LVNNILSHINKLSENTRFSGTEGNFLAKDYITNFLSSINVKYDFSYGSMPKWSLNGIPKVEFLSPETFEIEGIPAMFSVSSDGIVEGELVASDPIKMLESYEWDKYRVTQCGYEVGYIISSNHGVQIQPLPFGTLNSPCVMVDAQTNAKIKEWLEQEKEISVKINNPTTIDGEVKTTSIFGMTECENPLPFVCAHYDTVYDNYGSHDNASGVAILLELLKSKYKNNFHFAFFDAEECNKVGSLQLVDELIKAGKLESISYVVEIDSVGVGDEFGVLASKKIYKQLKSLDLNKLNFSSHKINLSQQTKIGFSDVWAFMSNGLPVIRLLTRGNNSNSIMHSKEDTPEKMEADTLLNAYKLCDFLLENLT